MGLFRLIRNPREVPMCLHGECMSNSAFKPRTDPVFFDFVAGDTAILMTPFPFLRNNMSPSYGRDAVFAKPDRVDHGAVVRYKVNRVLAGRAVPPRLSGNSGPQTTSTSPPVP